MGLTIAIVKETADCEKRVAATPETVKKYTGLGCKVVVEKGAGAGASIPDSAFKDAGAQIAADQEALFKSADIVLAVQAPDHKAIKKDALVIAMFAPYANEKLIDELAKAKINAFSMELVPRITRAQSMDVLSSQSNLAGYKSVLDACEYYGSAFPMMMTAAGTIPPARVLVMGAGVAGLQAIATARRLGAIVSATDVRPAAKEQVESLGGKFVAVEDDEFKEAETAGGYAKQMSAAYQKKQQALIEETIPKQDIVITTALIPGRPAPKLITEKMVKSMRPGSVIVDLAVENGGNCELAKLGKVVNVDDVNIIGHKNFPSRLASDASALYSRNLMSLLQLIIKDGKLEIDPEDEIIQGITLTRDGKIVHPNFGGKSAAVKKTATTAKPKAATAPANDEKTKTAKKKTATKSKPKKQD
ncbi:Re/Si-specific NAD(P)(+) transhydrogenase subunit alpha [Alphaproteobacteria bacterium]|nr:Re/Si-specific NAD(P)(+) transhydrogenase subunit alpha [Alphaproteobacteria bacterium]